MQTRFSSCRIGIVMHLLLAFHLAAGCEARASEVAGEVVVSPVQVANAMCKYGVETSVEDVVMLSVVRTRHPGGGLRVISVGRWGEGGLKAKLGCTERSDCLPFYVLVRNSSAAGEERAVSTGTPVHAQYDVHIGDAAILVFESSDSRITLRVICTENGALGQTIRVATRDRKHFYHARVIQPGLLKGIL